MAKGVFYTVLISSLFIVAAGASRSEYGENCNATSKCNKAAWLACQDNICVCSRYNEMIYDSAQKSCVVSAGERCRIAIGEDEDGRNMRYDVLKCVTNAACSSEGICKCGPGTFEADDGVCSLKMGYRSNCNSTNQCAESELLSCVKGLCGCDTETAMYVRDGMEVDSNGQYSSYSARFTQCAGLPGKNCLNGRCVANAMCDSSSNICKCKSLYTESSKGCLPGFGNDCSMGVQCASSLNCVGNKCMCKYPASQYITEETPHECISYAGGPCEPNGISKCAPNSECVTTESYGVCQCKSGYVRSDGFCDVDYGSPCPINPVNFRYNDFDSKKPFTYTGNTFYFTEQCNRRIPLICVNDMCACPDAGMVYDDVRSKCVWLVGFDCEDDTDECVENAICGQKNPGTIKRCSCAAGFVGEADRTCSKADVGTINIENSFSAKNDSAEAR